MKGTVNRVTIEMSGKEALVIKKALDKLLESDVDLHTETRLRVSNLQHTLKMITKRGEC